MNKSHLLKYLLISPNLPVGGFCYSEGMESFIDTKKINDSKSIKDLIRNELKFGQIRLDARTLVDFFDIFVEIKNKKSLKLNQKKLLSLNKWILSSKDSRQIRDQQDQMSKSLFELTKEFGYEYPYHNDKKSSWPQAWSWSCFCFDISKKEMIENYLYAWVANQLNAALRLIPMGSTKAQIIQLDLLQEISQVSEEILDKKTDDIYFGNVGLAMAQQKHNDLYTKLFRN